jgi:hypothetical protein
MQRKRSQVRQNGGKLVTHVLRAAARADLLNKGKVLRVRERMNVTQPRQLAPCKPAAICLLERGMAVLASGLGHGRAPPFGYSFTIHLRLLVSHPIALRIWIP